MTDLQALEAFLGSEKSPKNCMQLSDLDGLLTAIACSPNALTSEDWLPVAIGGSQKDMPAEAIELIMSRYEGIMTGLNGEPPSLEPLYWEDAEGRVIAMDWCEGFMQGCALLSDEWDRLLDSTEGRSLMFPILAHLLDQEGNSLVGARKDQMDALLDMCAEQIPDAVPKLFKFRRAEQTRIRLE